MGVDPRLFDAIIHMGQQIGGGFSQGLQAGWQDREKEEQRKLATNQFNQRLAMQADKNAAEVKHWEDLAAGRKAGLEETNRHNLVTEGVARDTNEYRKNNLDERRGYHLASLQSRILGPSLSAGISPAPGEIGNSIDDAYRFANEHGTQLLQQKLRLATASTDAANQNRRQMFVDQNPTQVPNPVTQALPAVGPFLDESLQLPPVLPLSPQQADSKAKVDLAQEREAKRAPKAAPAPKTPKPLDRTVRASLQKAASIKDPAQKRAAVKAIQDYMQAHGMGELTQEQGNLWLDPNFYKGP